MIKQEAHAKINLCLDVLYKRSDGYHEVRMVMQTLGLRDDVFLEPLAGTDGIELFSAEAEGTASDSEEAVRESEPSEKSGPEAAPAHLDKSPALSEVPYNEDNLMYRAAALMKETYGIREGVRLRLRKRIPVAAGLAGGSADAAAVLRGMNELFDLHAPLSELQALGLRLGADVPYCLLGGTALAEGIGEKLTALPKAPSCRVLLVKPAQGISTGSVYGALRVEERPAEAHPDVDGVLSALQEKNIRRLCARMGNILELAAEPMAPEISEIRSAIQRLGAVGARMSGSGPTVFGLFTDTALLQEAAEAFRKGPLSHLAKDVIETAFHGI